MNRTIGSNRTNNNPCELPLARHPSTPDTFTTILVMIIHRPLTTRWSFFIAFFIWFAISPLLLEIKDSLGLSKEEIWTSSIAGVGGTIFIRLLLGPLCDKYGARVLFTLVLCGASIPTACTGLVQSGKDLIILRAFIGMAGGTFVMTEYWASRMFTKEVVGTANAIVAGWGNLGASVTQMVIGSFLFPIFRAIFGGDSELAWRVVSIVPAVVGFVTGVVIYFITDDAPKGNYTELKRHGLMKEVNLTHSFCSAAFDRNTWLMFLQYAACFGVELTMYNAATLYFKVRKRRRLRLVYWQVAERAPVVFLFFGARMMAFRGELFHDIRRPHHSPFSAISCFLETKQTKTQQDVFGQSTESAGAIASIFGWMNLFARGLGGVFSDALNESWGMRGRLVAQAICLLGEGCAVLIFAHTHTLAGAVCILVVFSLFVQAAEGTSFGIAPYINPRYTGSVTGIVGAGGNVGAVAFGLCFRQFNYSRAFDIMGTVILISTAMTIFYKIPGHAGLVTGVDMIVDKETGEIVEDGREEMVSISSRDKQTTVL
jgi:MFS transporter, NNP family, nitrate/nitrite transporter